MNNPLLIDFLNLKKSLKKHVMSMMMLFVLFTSVNVFSQNFENVAITGVISGNNTNNCLFSATSPTIPTLARVRVQQISGGGTVRIYQTGDNFTYEHNSGFTAGIPNNLTRFRISFLLADGVTLIPLNDYRFVINDIDGPNNESLATNCGSGIRFTATAIPTNLVVDNTPPDLNATGTVNETGGLTSRVMYEFNDLNQIVFDCYANNGFIKEFDINYNNFTIATPLYAVCLNDTDGDGVSDDLDLDDDNDGILDSVEAGGNDPNGDHDGDGLPNFLDVTDNSGAHPTYIANADGSVTNYTDADSDGLPDIYESSLAGDTIPNHLDLDSDDDGCSDANEYYNVATADGGDGGVYGVGAPAVNPTGTVIAASYIGAYANVVSPAADPDGDGLTGICETDNDNDGILDATDPDDTNPDICGDSDGDGCDDCSVGTDNFGPLSDSLPLNDGTDTDADGLCDAGDPDDDNDGILDATDSNDTNPDICGDSDVDGCDDCSVGTDNFGPLSDSLPLNDGTDTDGDGLCDAGDHDDDNDGILDATDPNDTNPDICGDSDGDGCDDCSVGTDNFGPLSDSLPLNDGTDTDADGDITAVSSYCL